MILILKFIGGGVGISVFGKFRIATEKTLFAMPETAIGLFPDVGSSFWLSKLPSGFGEYLGLTGCRLRYDMLLRLGIATHFVPSDKLVELEDEIVQSVSPGDPQATTQLIGSILRKYQGKLPPAPTESPEELFKGKMDAGELYRDVMMQLDAAIPWQAEIQKSLRAASPTALHLAFQQIKIAREKNLSVQDCLKMVI
jgi:enoyl-CoA hydratase/carnithine racemase